MKTNVTLTISELVINNQRFYVCIPVKVEMKQKPTLTMSAFGHIAPNDYVHLAIEVLAYDNVHGTLWLNCARANLHNKLTEIVGWTVKRRQLQQRLDDVDAHHPQEILKRIRELKG